MSDLETIVAAAIRSGERTWSLPAPARHRDVIRVARRDHGATLANVSPCNQGFLTSAGRFVDRYEAGDIAMKARQVTSLHGCELMLTSEDLW